MRFKSLESRIIALFITLLVLMQAAGFFVIHYAIDKNARNVIHSELVIGERVFRHLLEQNAQKLTQGARLLAADYGFRAAIATDDRDTIASVLINHGARIGSSLALWVGNDGEIKAATLPQVVPDLARSAHTLAEQAELGGSAVSTVMIDHHVMQLVAVPVKAPLTIGWVVMGFPIDHSLIADMKLLSSLQVSILVRANGGAWRADVSTMDADDSVMLGDQLGGQAPTDVFIPLLQLGDNDYSARMLVLTRNDVGSAVVVLQQSISEAVAPYRERQLMLMLICGLGVVIAIVGSAFMAKRIVRPLRQLAAVAKRWGDGDYTVRSEIRGDDEIAQLALAFDDMRLGISQRETQIKRLAYWDTLTDLPNRIQFVDLLKGALAEARAAGGSCSVLMLDLHRFQQVNDVLGHRVGDQLLRQVGQRLAQQLLRSSDRVARLGGDEFALLLPGVDLADAQNDARRIIASLELPITLQDQTVDLGAGIGVVTFPVHGENADVLLSRVEMAMYAAKRSGHDIVVYDATIDRGSQDSLSLLGELRRALDEDQFQLYVQPKLALASGRMVGVEALVRWVHPDKGMIGPDDFIPFAESTGFIGMLTYWVLEQSAVLCKMLQAAQIDLKISINLSTRDLLDQELPVTFSAILARHAVSATSFCLEITESAIMGDPVRAQQTLERLCELGCELSIDDFGTGYSSLAYLKNLPVHELKIDKSFVMNMEYDVDDAKIVRSTIDLGHNMGLRVVAEGVENVAVWHLLVQMGCDQAQGYFMAKPMPVARLLPWIREWRSPLAVSVVVAG